MKEFIEKSRIKGLSKNDLKNFKNNDAVQVVLKNLLANVDTMDTVAISEEMLKKASPRLFQDANTRYR